MDTSAQRTSADSTRRRIGTTSAPDEAQGAPPLRRANRLAYRHGTRPTFTVTRSLRLDGVVAALIGAAAISCVRGEVASDGAASRDSVASAPGIVEIADTVRRVVAPPVPPPVPSSGSRPAPPADTALVDATPAELAELARALIVPVAGVNAEELIDTFTESRGGGSRPHDAIDILAPRGTPVLAATDGKVEKLHSSAAGGLMIYAADAHDRFVMMYGHLDGYADGLAEEMPLRRGQVIGYVGTTGNAPAGTPHLHFAIARGTPSWKWWRGKAVNPYPLLAASLPARQ